MAQTGEEAIMFPSVVSSSGLHPLRAKKAFRRFENAGNFFNQGRFVPIEPVAAKQQEHLLRTTQLRQLFQYFRRRLLWKLVSARC